MGLRLEEQQLEWQHDYRKREFADLKFGFPEGSGSSVDRHREDWKNGNGGSRRGLSVDIWQNVTSLIRAEGRVDQSHGLPQPHINRDNQIILCLSRFIVDPDAFRPIIQNCQ
jgi:hypothetical protein